jgi:predicted transcriptional regulator
MKRKELSDLELEVLRYLAGAGSKTAREAADEFGEANGYARTTVLTLLERLRQKGYLSRSKVEGVFRYQSRVSSDELMRGVVGQFVQRSLGGSVSPLVAFLSQNRRLSDEELAELRCLVDSMEGGS